MRVVEDIALLAYASTDTKMTTRVYSSAKDVAIALFKSLGIPRRLIVDIPRTSGKSAAMQTTRYGWNAASGMSYPTDPEESWRSAIDPLGPR
jgi:hypothetical protein